MLAQISSTTFNALDQIMPDHDQTPSLLSDPSPYFDLGGSAQRQLAIPARSAHGQQLAAQLDKLANQMVPRLLTGPNGSEFDLLANRLAHALQIDLRMPLRALHGGKVATDDLAMTLIELSDRDQPIILHLTHVEQLSPVNQQQIKEFILNYHGKEVSTADKAVLQRLILSTEADLTEAAQNHQFDSRLRLYLLPGQVRVPSLAERREDVPMWLDRALALHWRDPAQFASQPRLSPAAQALLMSYDWPGNLRELLSVARKVAQAGHPLPLEPEQLVDHLGSIESIAPAGADIYALPEFAPETISLDDLNQALQSSRRAKPSAARPAATSTINLGKYVNL